MLGFHLSPKSSRPMDSLELSYTLNVVLLSVIVIYVLHRIIKRGSRKQVLFVIVFFAIISYFYLRSFFVIHSTPAMTRSPRGLTEAREAESSMRFTIKENHTAIPAPYSYLEAAAEMEPSAAQVPAVQSPSTTSQSGKPCTTKHLSEREPSTRANLPVLARQQVGGTSFIKVEAAIKLPTST